MLARLNELREIGKKNGWVFFGIGVLHDDDFPGSVLFRIDKSNHTLDEIDSILDAEGWEIISVFSMGVEGDPQYSIQAIKRLNAN